MKNFSLNKIALALGLSIVLSSAPAYSATKDADDEVKATGADYMMLGVGVAGLAVSPVAGIVILGYEATELGWLDIPFLDSTHGFRPTSFSKLTGAEKQAWRVVVSDAVKTTCGGMSVQKGQELDKGDYYLKVSQTKDALAKDRAEYPRVDAATGKFFHYPAPTWEEAHVASLAVIKGRAHGLFLCVSTGQLADGTALPYGSASVEAYVQKGKFYLFVSGKPSEQMSLSDLVAKGRELSSRNSVDEKLFD